ncbi:metallophosphoesterase [Flavisolibacter ginsenosidimutans]|uniref:Metallophosphoesterase n=2 Tax=Flavisolibacter ginsenosidimutans TaxID=661481 RepID=A0A5B8UQ23_9BACT|nr:metallophosphoesterase [Flavisolibacter ginsenosidimutans]
MFVETLWLRSHNNRKATRLLFEDVWHRHPAAFFMLGDLVNLGYSNRQWKPIDRYVESLRSKGIPVHAILGNHEVMGRPRLGMHKFQQRFPDHQPTGYCKCFGNVAVVLVNSNFSTLSVNEEVTQTIWYQKTLEQLDEDNSVHFIVTGCHHSPYTNSRIVKPSKEVEEKFVPAFLQSRKSCLFLSGHCHAYEHYKVEGKDFLVIGGGGGLKQPLRQGIGTLADVALDYKPLFHYVMVEVLDDVLEVTSYHIKKDFSGFEEGAKTVIHKNILVSNVGTAGKKEGSA